jgi:hypothetical protein
MTHPACVGADRTDIGQLADVAGGRPGHDERVEVRIALDAADPGARALYEGAFGGMLQVMERREANGSSPDVAAATITRALTARRPRAVYLSGKDSRRLAILSGLPAPVLDMARRRVFRLPAPGSLAS